MLLDSNILIYASKPEFDWLITDYIHADSTVSIITKIEVMGFHQLQSNHHQLLQQFFELIPVIDLDNEIATLAIKLKQLRKMSLGDAIIASTALLSSQSLITRNTADFAWIPTLQVINPID